MKDCEFKDYFQLENREYVLGDFKIICNISENICLFDLYHLGFRVGFMDLRSLEKLEEMFKIGQEIKHTLVVTIEIKKEKNQSKKSFEWLHTDNSSMGRITMCNINGGNIFKPILIELNNNGAEHVIFKREVLFEKTFREQTKIDWFRLIRSFVFGIDPANNYVQAIQGQERTQHHLIDYNDKLK